MLSICSYPSTEIKPSNQKVGIIFGIHCSRVGTVYIGNKYLGMTKILTDLNINTL